MEENKQNEDWITEDFEEELPDNTKKKNIIWGLVCVLCVVIGIAGVGLYKYMNDVKFLTRDNVTYEAGQTVTLEPANFLKTSQMKEDVINNVQITSDLMDSEEYSYDANTKQVTTNGKSYLEPGNYTVVLTLGNESKEVGFTVQDTQGPEFVGFYNRIIIEQNALDVDLSKYFLATDLSTQASIEVKGSVDLATEGEYSISVKAVDTAGNETIKVSIVQVVSEDTMISQGIELTPMINNEVPVSEDTRNKVNAYILNINRSQVDSQITDTINNLGLDLSSYHSDSYLS